MTATPAIPNGTKDALGLLNRAVFKPLDAMATNAKSKLNIFKCFTLEPPKKPDVMTHSGRTDSGGGHNNRVGGNGAIPYHFHHTLGPHMPCCRSGSRQAASIINPYTGREINLGTPYVFQNQNYFSVNLVARALTVWDTMGASLSLLPVLPPFFNAGGSFSACNRGESAGSTLATLGERFLFIYPTLPIIGTIRNNTFFEANGDKGGRLQLLCHTTQAELDPDVCYAYISLETLRAYMLSDGFFTGFAPNMPANVWSFTHSIPLAEITSPRHNENFQVGDTLIVRASVQDVREAALTINGRVIETRTELSERNIVFAGYTLTAGDIGSLVIGVNAQNGQGIMVNLPTVRINVVDEFSVDKPHVWVFEPSEGDVFNVGDSVRVSAYVRGITNAELIIGNYRQASTHPFNYQAHNTTFQPYTFTSDDVGEIAITVNASNSQGQSAADTIRVRVADDTASRMMENLAQDTTLNIPSIRRSTMVITGQHLLYNGYDPAFVAGMLANIEGEGNFGQFEGAGNQSYLQYFINSHNYRDRFSWKHIYSESRTPAVYDTLQEIYDMVVNSGQNNIFGLGAIQRTNRPRFLPLIRAYGVQAGGMDRRIATRTQVITAENDLLIRELRGEETNGVGTGSHVGGGGVAWGSNLLTVWRTRNPNSMDSDEAARDAGALITRSFVRPNDPNGIIANERANLAAEIFHVMMQ